MISPSPWTVREGRSTRYLYVCDAEGTKIAEVDLWTATTNDAVLMANAPRLLIVARAVAVLLHTLGDRNVWQELDDAIAAAETPFVQGYKPIVSAE